MRGFLAIAAALFAATPLSADPGAGWTLVWSDEFDGAKIDRAKWRFDEDCWGGGNEERQCYTRNGRNAAIEDGKLVITARRERVTGPALPQQLRLASAMPDVQATRDFSSARLTTRGKAAWRYGKVEVRAMLPQGQGTWPAIWMLPSDDAYGKWAASGEIDILEAVNLGEPCKGCPGGRESTILGTLHFGDRWPRNAHKGEEVSAPEVLEGFHIFGIEWEPGRITWQIDGRTFAVREVREWWSAGSKAPGAPFDREFYLILNLAIGGRLAEGRGLGGVMDDGYPKRFVIDWVRVWQKQAPGVTSSQRRGN